MPADGKKKRGERGRTRHKYFSPSPCILLLIPRAVRVQVGSKEKRGEKKENPRKKRRRG